MESNDISQTLNQIDASWRQIHDFEYRVERAKSLANHKATEYETIKETLEKSRIERAKRAGEVGEFEREVDSLTKKLHLRKEQLDAAKSNREYETLKQQVERLEKENDRLADVTLLAIEGLERVDSDLKALELRAREKLGEVEKSKRNLDSIGSRALAEVRMLRARLQKMVERLPREYAAAYAKLVKEGEDPVAALIDDNYCGSCNQKLPPDLVLKLRSAGGALCQSCGKLLFIQLSGEENR